MKIKKLKFEKTRTLTGTNAHCGRGWTKVARTPIGRYTVNFFDRAAPLFLTEYRGMPIHESTTEAEAVAAAQAYFEANIKECME